MLTSEALPMSGVPPVAEAGGGKWVSVAPPPSPFDGITPPTMKTAPSLAAHIFSLRLDVHTILKRFV